MQSHVSREERYSLIESILFHSPDGVRAVELAERCGVDRRTIYRDIAKLRKNGLPLYQQQGRFFVSREYYHAPVQLTLNETVALFTAVRVLSHVADQHNPHVISALNKLSEGLPRSMADHVGAVGDMLRHRPVDRLFVRVTEAIIHAWGAQRWVRIWTSGEQTALELAPHFMEATPDGALCVVGVEAGTEAVRAFRLDDILRIETLKRTFNRRPEVEPERHMADALGEINEQNPDFEDIVLLLAPDFARQVIPDKFSSVVHTSEMPDGRMQIQLRVRSWQGVLPWIHRAGSQVEVLQPQAMRQHMAQEARRLAALYEGNRAHQ